MRCPDCNKFVSFDEPEIEGDEPSVVGTTVSGTVRIVLKCAECGNELKEANPDYEVEIEHNCDKCKKNKEPEFTPDGTPDFSSTSRRETTMKVKKKGVMVDRQIPFRYQKQYYGAEITGNVTCSECEESIEYHAEVEERASGFDELV